MTVTGFPNALQFSRLNSAITNLKTQSEEARVEMVTQRPSDLKTALAGTIGNVQLLRKSIDDIAVFAQATNRALGRAAIAQLALTGAKANAAQISVSALDAVGTGNEVSVGLAGDDAERQLNVAVAALNKSFEGRALFSGDAVDQSPLADANTLLTDIRTIYAAAADATQLATDLDFYFDDPTGGFATNIYQGGTGDAPRVEIGKGEVVAYSAKANEAAVRDLLRSLSTIVVASEKGQSVDRDTTLKAAAVKLVEAGNGVTTIQARIGGAEGRMQLALSTLDAENTALGLAYNERVSRDPFEAAVRLQQLESQLESAFVLSARVSQLTLVNFLR